jgi:hypothetical protein
VNWIDLTIYIISSVVITVLLYLVIWLWLRNRRVLAQAAQSEFDRLMTLAQLENVKTNNEVEQTDGFLKFISDSRDWAFDYIEKVQDAINAYDEALSKNDATAMNEAYKNLIAMLPEDDVVK